MLERDGSEVQNLAGALKAAGALALLSIWLYRSGAPRRVLIWWRDLRRTGVSRRAALKLHRQHMKRELLQHRAWFGRNPDWHRAARRKRLRRTAVAVVVIFSLFVAGTAGYKINDGNGYTPEVHQSDQ